MIFPHSFYEDGIRCDYVIPSMIKRSWAAQLQILEDIDRACKTAGLEYFAEWGTLLGAVRHAGFIPWDDDIDICMKRKDYEYLIKNADKLFPDNYSVVSFRSNSDFKQMLCRVVSSDHYRFDGEYMGRYSGLPVALGIDIFPLDFLTDDGEYEKEREERARLVFEAVNELAYFGTKPAALEERFSLIEKRCKTHIDRKGDILLELRLLLEKIYGEVDEEKASRITLYPLWQNSHEYAFPKEYYSKSVRMPFENTDIPVPLFYNSILTKKYGKDYLRPVRSGGAHDYPYVEGHLQVLKEHFGFEWPTYKFNENDLPKGRTLPEKSAKKSCLFITYGAAAFENMRRVVRKYLDDGYDVTIYPAQTYDIAPDMSGITASDNITEDGFYLKGLSGAVIKHDKDIPAGIYTVIVTNFPYDEYNLITATDKEIYSKVLRERCERLVYVPPFEAEKIGPDDGRAIKLMPMYVCTPMPVVCDEIVLKSCEMKKRYVDCLSSFSGESFRQVWEDKIAIVGKTVKEKRRDGRKSRILFYIDTGLFAECGKKAAERIKDAFGIFSEHSDKTEAVFASPEGMEEDLKKNYPDLYDIYMSCGFNECTHDVDTEDIDAYYGVPSPYVPEFMNAGRPVMIMNETIKERGIENGT